MSPIGRAHLLAKAYEHVYQHPDLPLVQRCLDRVSGTHLALGCGTGRELVVSLVAGRQVVGIEMWEDMLDVARAKLLPRYAHLLTLHHNDFTSMLLPRNVGLITCLSNTWPMILDRESRKTMWRRCYEGLVIGGLMMVVIVNSYPEGLHQRNMTFEMDNGSLQFNISWEVDPEKLLRIYTLQLAWNETSENHTIPTALISHSEMLADAQSAGFQLDAIYGDYDLSPQSVDSPWQVLVLRK